MSLIASALPSWNSTSCFTFEKGKHRKWNFNLVVHSQYNHAKLPVTHKHSELNIVTSITSTSWISYHDCQCIASYFFIFQMCNRKWNFDLVAYLQWNCTKWPVFHLHPELNMCSLFPLKLVLLLSICNQWKDLNISCFQLSLRNYCLNFCACFLLLWMLSKFIV